MNPKIPGDHPASIVIQSLHLLVLAVVTFVTLTAGLFAQRNSSGTVYGRVTNEITGDPLNAATVSIVGTNLSTATLSDGTYALSVPAGEHMLSVQYTGFDTSTTRINVQADSRTLANQALNSQIYTLDTINVKGIREGQAQALQVQRTAANIKQVVAIDAYGSPAANPGELIQRLPGITVDIVGSEIRTINVRGMSTDFSQLLVDGERVATSGGTSVTRNYQIEQLGTGSLSTVELIKAPTADMDASAISGFVNLVSRRAYEASRRSITAQAGVLWRERDNTQGPFKDKIDNLDLFSFSYSDVFSVNGGERNFGLATNFLRRRSYTTQDEMGPAALTNIASAFIGGASPNPLQRVFGTGDFGYKAISTNFGLSADYKFNDDANAFLNFTRNTNHQYQLYFRPTIGKTNATVADFSANSTFEHTTLLGGATADMESSNFDKQSKNYQVKGGMQVRLLDGRGLLDVKGTYSHADIFYPGWVRVHARAPATIGFEIDRRGRDPWYPKFTQIAGPDITAASTYTLRDITKTQYKAPNEILGGRIDFKYDLGTALPAYIKTGVKYDVDKRKHRRIANDTTFVGADRIANTSDDSLAPYATINYSQAASHYGPFPFAGAPGVGGVGDVLDAPESYFAQSAGDVYNSYVGSLSSNSDVQESIAAAYLLANVVIGKLRIQGGLRMEETDVESTGWIRNASSTFGGNNVNGGSFTDADKAANLARAQKSFVGQKTQKGNYRDFFPSMLLTYSLTKDILARASYNRSIARPNSTLLIPSININSNNNTVSVGNPDLKPYFADNFELALEKYFEPIGLFSVSGFLKEISDYTRTFTDVVGPQGYDGDTSLAGYTLTQTRNVGDARVRGIEFNYSQSFRFLPGFLKDLSLNANYTIQETEGNFGATSNRTDLPGFTPRSGNLSLAYSGGRFEARILANWRDTYLLYQASGDIDVYSEPRTMIDLKFKYRINEHFNVYLDVANAFDVAARTDTVKNGIHYFKTQQGAGFSSGVTARF